MATDGLSKKDQIVYVIGELGGLDNLKHLLTDEVGYMAESNNLSDT